MQPTLVHMWRYRDDLRLRCGQDAPKGRRISHRGKGCGQAAWCEAAAADALQAHPSLVLFGSRALVSSVPVTSPLCGLGPVPFPLHMHVKRMPFFDRLVFKCSAHVALEVALELSAVR